MTSQTYIYRVMFSDQFLQKAHAVARLDLHGSAERLGGGWKTYVGSRDNVTCFAGQHAVMH